MAFKMPPNGRASSTLLSAATRWVGTNRHRSLLPPVSSKEQEMFSRSILERAGFKIGPGVDLKMK